MNSKPLLIALLAIGAIWGVVAAVMGLTEKHTSTPEKVQELMTSAPWFENENLDEAARKKHLDEVIAHVNRLDFDQRRQNREDDPEIGRRFMDSLTKPERHRFLEETVEQHFKSVMKAFNQMSREERQRVVANARRDMQRDSVDSQNMRRLEQEDEKVFENVVEKGLGAYYQEASAETKMDLAPLMEEMQERMRGFGPPRR
jgi:catalase